MKIILSMELDDKEFEEYFEDSLAKDFKEEIKQELVNRLFETCEEWVLRGQVPDLEFEDEHKGN